MYGLGVDLGTTYTAAAVWREGRAEICALGTRSAAVPSVLLVREDGTVLTGEAAARRAVVEPDRVAREFKRRLGDVTPLVLGGRPFPAETLMARLLSAIVSAVVDREGGTASRVVVSHPANWGPYTIDLLRRAVTLADLGVPVSLTTEPEAAAVDYARTRRLTAGGTVAVYDLGGGTFDAAVLRGTEDGFTILGRPEGVERLGGIDIDAAVFAHVARFVGSPLAGLDEEDPRAVAAVARLREECVAAKEALSADTDTTIPVLLPGYTGEVRLTRSELETMVRPLLGDSIEALGRALRSAGITPSELTAVLLVGGSSRIPLVARLVSAELGRPVTVDVHPKHAVALGAAWLAGQAAQAAPDAAGAGAPGPLVLARRRQGLPPGRPARIGVAAGTAAALLAGYFALAGDGQPRPVPADVARPPTAASVTGRSSPARTASIAAVMGSHDAVNGQSLAEDGGGPPQPASRGLAVTVLITGGTGRVTSTDGRISCPGRCAATYPAGSAVTLVASARGFLGWVSCGTRAGARCTVSGRGSRTPLARYLASPVQPSTARPATTGPATTEPPTTGPATTGEPPTTEPATTEPATTGPATTGEPPTTEPATTGPPASYAGPEGPTTPAASA
jgi:molecular chaperone DnaK